MKRLHVHVSVEDLPASIRFYRELFDAEPSWIEDPQGVEWETFLTTGESTIYGTDEIKPKSSKPCCTPYRTA